MNCQLVWTLDEDDPELELRKGPLRDQWEARGPGMIKYLSTQFPWLDLPGVVTIRLVKPKRTGGGLPAEEALTAAASSTVRFDAWLVNPWPQLPEVVRLCWLCCCLRNGHNPRSRLALLPMTVSAAEHVGLATLEGPTLACGLTHWLGEPSCSARQLLHWWSEVAGGAEDAAAWTRAIDQLPGIER